MQDVSTAVREQADALMLSGETATGAYPLETVQVMKNIIQSIEPSVNGALNTTIRLEEPKAKMLRSAAVLAQELGKSGIVVFTLSGFLAHALGALQGAGGPDLRLHRHPVGLPSADAAVGRGAVPDGVLGRSGAGSLRYLPKTFLAAVAASASSTTG